MRIPLNRFVGKFPLSFEFEIRNGSFKGFIPIPENYPKTPITERYKKFGLIDITISDDLFIEYLGLIVNEGDKRLLATDEEKLAFKGVGKQILCLSLQLILFKYDNLSKDTNVLLEAYGERCSKQYMPDVYKTKALHDLIKEAVSVNPHGAYIIAKQMKIKIAPVGEEKKLLLLYKKFPLRFDENLIRLQACSIIENDKLIEYYKSLGFRLEAYYEGIVMASMSGRVRDILC